MLCVTAGRPRPAGGDETLDMLSRASAAKAYAAIRGAVQMCADDSIELPGRLETDPRAFSIPPPAIAALRARAKGEALKAVCAWSANQRTAS